MSVVKPTSQVAAAHDVTGATAVQFTGPVTKSVNKSLPSVNSTAHCKDQDPTSPTEPMEEEGEVSDQK